MFSSILRFSLFSLFIYLSVKHAIADEVEQVLKGDENLLDTFLLNLTNWLVETCSMYNTSNEPIHHNVLNMTKNFTEPFDFTNASNDTKYVEETIVPLTRGLLHGLIDEYYDHKVANKTADDFVQPCNCTVLLTIGQLGMNVSYNDTMDINRECEGVSFAKL